jgi:hypothetical protein
MSANLRNQIGLQFKMRNCVKNIGCNSQSIQPLTCTSGLLAAFTRRITQIASQAWQGGDPTCQGQGSTNGLAQEIGPHASPAPQADGMACIIEPVGQVSGGPIVGPAFQQQAAQQLAHQVDLSQNRILGAQVIQVQDAFQAFEQQLDLPAQAIQSQYMIWRPGGFGQVGDQENEISSEQGILTRHPPFLATGPASRAAACGLGGRFRQALNDQAHFKTPLGCGEPHRKLARPGTWLLSQPIQHIKRLPVSRLHRQIGPIGTHHDRCRFGQESPQTITSDRLHMPSAVAHAPTSRNGQSHTARPTPTAASPAPISLHVYVVWLWSLSPGSLCLSESVRRLAPSRHTPTEGSFQSLFVLQEDSFVYSYLQYATYCF